MRFEHNLWLLSFVAQFLLAVAVERRQLPYPFFRIWLWASLLRTVALRVAGATHEAPYFNTYLVTEPLVLALLVAVVLELFQKRASGLVMGGSTASILFGALLAVAALFTATSFLYGAQAPREAALASIVAFRRIALSMLLVFLVATLVFFNKFPAPARHNLIIHHRVLILHLAGPVAAIVAIWFHPLGSHWYNAVALAFTGVSFVVWIVFMRKQGEQDPCLPGADHAQALEQSAGELLEDLRSAAKSARRPGPPPPSSHRG